MRGAAKARPWQLILTFAVMAAAAGAAFGKEDAAAVTLICVAGVLLLALFLREAGAHWRWAHLPFGLRYGSDRSVLRRHVSTYETKRRPSGRGTASR